MAKKATAGKASAQQKKTVKKPRTESSERASGKPSSLLDTRVIYCGDCLDQLRQLPDDCIDLIYIDPPFNSNRNDRAESIRIFA